MAETIDVREMLCAQALAQVSSVMRRVDAGALIDVVCNAEDVREDLLAWADAQGHEVLEVVQRSREILIRVRKP